MRMGALVLGAVVAFTMGCAGTDDGSDSSNVKSSRDPLALPQSIIDFQNARGWGDHHLEWHTERQWDRLNPSDRDWAKKHGWKRAGLQEGQKGNGLEFLAMHRAMLRMLTDEFPKNRKYFTGWTTPPTNPRDKTSPLPHGQDTEFDANMAEAIEKLANHIDDFKTDDELGLFIETKARPTMSDPRHRSDDPSAGIHNYLHNRFMDPDSSIDIGDPHVNLQNKMFWRLHGWIDARWTAFREAKGLTEDQADYASAIEAATAELEMKMSGGATKGVPDAPPDSLTKFFEGDDSL